MALTQELHVIRAHHLHYLSLLDHYTKHVTFIKNTPNPAMDGMSDAERISSEKLLNRECDNLMNEIQRLNAELNTQERRLKNVMDLVSYLYHPSILLVNRGYKVFSSVNITDSRYMRQMTEATVRDSAGKPLLRLLDVMKKTHPTAAVCH